MEAGDKHARVIIVGAGFSGLGLAIRLLEQGTRDFLILERAEDVGGTWTANTYPGCTCDIPSHLYSFSFAPNPDWSHTYSTQPEIREYLRRCADQYGVRPHLRTGVAVGTANWLEGQQQWELDTSAGIYTAEVLVSAMGPLTEPKLPNVPGLADFEGKLVHSARWDHDYDLRGKRVASIGTGASAIQYVPEIAGEVEQLYVFQRTAPWVMPHGNRPITRYEHALYRRLPLAQRIVRGVVYSSRELLVLGFAKRPRMMRLIERLSRSHIRKQVLDPELLRQVTPTYAIGCKRIVPSNRWYPTLELANVELVSSGLAEVRAHSVRDTDGVERDVDAIVLGTGFHVTDMPAAYQITGREGIRLEDAWQGSPRAYLGASIPQFPNFFMLLGPNTGLGHGSMVYMIESQIAHVLQAINTLQRSGGTTIEVRPAAHASFNRDVDARMRGTIWDIGGCSSFYLDRNGRNATLWPDWTWRFRRLAANPEMDAYTVSSPKTAAVPA